MDNIIELIFTLVVGFFWLFGGTLFNKKQDEQQEPFQPTTRSRKNRRGSESDSKEEERQREIRESIRRKIEERRRQSEPGPVIAFEPEPQEELIAVEEPATTFSLNTDDTLYEETIKERLQAIEATKRKAEALRKKAEAVVQRSYQSNEAENTEQEDVLFVGSVQSALKNLRNARAAFIYGEVLGKPISLCSPPERGPGG